MNIYIYHRQFQITDRGVEAMFQTKHTDHDTQRTKKRKRLEISSKNEYINTPRLLKYREIKGKSN